MVDDAGTRRWFAQRRLQSSDDVVGPPSDGRRVLRILSSAPLIVATVVESVDDVGVASALLAADHQGVRFIGVVAADDEEHLELILGEFQPHLAEVIFTAAVGPSNLAGAEAAWLALERHWMGQDFVFTVPALVDAVRYAVDCLTPRRHDHQWEGTAILVLGGSQVIDAARALVQRRHGSEQDDRST